MTPDPHRTTAERHAGLPLHAEDAAARPIRTHLHRVFVADRLVARAGLLVTVPARAGADDLAAHFPQLSPTAGAGRAEVPEGLPPFVPRPGDSAVADATMARLFAGGGLPDGLDPEDRDLRLLLYVGHLHPVKQQDRLVEAWLDTGPHRSTTLLLVGGSPNSPTAVEAGVRAAIAKLLDGQPLVRRRTALWPALPNRRVRILERALAERQAGSAVYVCERQGGVRPGRAGGHGRRSRRGRAGTRRGPALHPGRRQRVPAGHRLGYGPGAGLVPVCATPRAELDAMAARARRTVRRGYSVDAMAGALARAYTAAPWRPVEPWCRAIVPGARFVAARSRRRDSMQERCEYGPATEPQMVESKKFTRRSRSCPSFGSFMRPV
ncbi:hypothetical protein [Kitasatospora sp. NPDC093679]|uniref:hypothetical protein n=1 Tax=Kitasatospora sp. NPDC093679 TaxID=3154983 RepID=UPI00341C4681